jgi:hypothetical protein
MTVLSTTATTGMAVMAQVVAEAVQRRMTQRNS